MGSFKRFGMNAERPREKTKTAVEKFFESVADGATTEAEKDERASIVCRLAIGALKKLYGCEDAFFHVTILPEKKEGDKKREGKSILAVKGRFDPRELGSLLGYICHKTVEDTLSEKIDRLVMAEEFARSDFGALAAIAKSLGMARDYLKDALDNEPDRGSDAGSSGERPAAAKPGEQATGSPDHPIARAIAANRGRVKPVDPDRTADYSSLPHWLKTLFNSAGDNSDNLSATNFAKRAFAKQGDAGDFFRPDRSAKAGTGHGGDGSDGGDGGDGSDGGDGGSD